MASADSSAWRKAALILVVLWFGVQAADVLGGRCFGLRAGWSEVGAKAGAGGELLDPLERSAMELSSFTPGIKR